jgi:acyl-homoserine-lactone acylase
MMPNSPFMVDKYPQYIYNDPQDRSNPRGRSAIRLLSATDNMTVEQAKEIALDTSVEGVAIWQTALVKSFEANLSTFADLKEAVNLLQSWNGRLDADNSAAALFRFWRLECGEVRESDLMEVQGTKDKLTKERQQKLLKALRNAKNYLTDKFGSIQVPWGTTVRLKRDDKTWPVSGGSFGQGISVLRAASGKFNKETGITHVNSGQSCCMVVALTKPIQSFSILPWGESDDPASPHYTDQAEKLFSKATFKSTFFNKNELMENLEATKNLVIPELKK